MKLRLCMFHFCFRMQFGPILVRCMNYRKGQLTCTLQYEISVAIQKVQWRSIKLESEIRHIIIDIDFFHYHLDEISSKYDGLFQRM